MPWVSSQGEEILLLAYLSGLAFFGLRETSMLLYGVHVKAFYGV